MPILFKLSPPMYPSTNQSNSFRIVISNTRAVCESCVCGDMALGSQGSTATENGINSTVRNNIHNGTQESESSCSVAKKG